MVRILVIEDEEDIRINIQEILELNKFEVLAAADGLEGLHLAKTKVPDLILCDVMLPEANGYQVLEALRQDEKTAMLPLIFLTAKADRADLRLGMELGADDYLTKPFESQELLRAIATRLEKQSLWNQQYSKEQAQTRQLRQQIEESQRKLQASQQLVELKDDLLQRLSQDLRNPLSNINIAIHMIRKAETSEERDRYLGILQEECAREITLLNEIEHLQTLLTPENAQLLQRFKLLNG